MPHSQTQQTTERERERYSTADNTLSLSIITTLFMKLLGLSYLVNYVLVERLRYEIHKVAGLLCQSIDRQALSFILNS